MTNLLIDMYKLGLTQVLVPGWITTNLDNSTEYLLSFYIDGPQAGVHEYYLEEKYSKIIKSYRHYLQQIVQIIADDANLQLNKSAINEQIDEIMEFDHQLALIRNKTELKENVRDSSIKIRLSELYLIFPFIEWKQYLCEIWGQQLNDYFSNDPYVYVESPDEFFGLTKLLLKTDKRIIANYMMLVYATSRIPSMDQRFEKLTQV